LVRLLGVAKTIESFHWKNQERNARIDAFYVCQNNIGNGTNCLIRKLSVPKKEELSSWQNRNRVSFHPLNEQFCRCSKPSHQRQQNYIDECTPHDGRNRHNLDLTLPFSLRIE
jgi:hypothetical protein